ncbi:putative uncharacterized protein C5orf58 homolog [Macrotis lagotis]|uniref:putative uncharacterized protein C5orf58 homolog n=1 Tax=Macrotis lagotis TaxID=92651 RepID=UPI003D685140
MPRGRENDQSEMRRPPQSTAGSVCERSSVRARAGQGGAVGCALREERRLGQIFKKNMGDQQINLKTLIKNIEKMSLDLKKMDELTKLLLCDLILHFNHPIKTEVIEKIEENNIVSEEFKISD